MKEKKKEATKQFHMKMTEEEYELFNRLVKARGISATAFVKNRIFNNESDILYNREVEKAIHVISDLLLDGVSENCDNKEFIQECQKGVKQLWLHLQ